MGAIVEEVTFPAEQQEDVLGLLKNLGFELNDELKGMSISWYNQIIHFKEGDTYTATFVVSTFHKMFFEWR